MAHVLLTREMARTVEDVDRLASLVRREEELRCWISAALLARTLTPWSFEMLAASHELRALQFMLEIAPR